MIALQICNVIDRSPGPLGQLIDQTIEWWMSPVPFGEQRFGNGPGDAKRGIIPSHANFPRRIVEIRALVFHLRDGTRHTEAMGEAWRHIALFEVVCRNRNPTQRAKVGEPRLKSTATSKISPSMTRINLPCGRLKLHMRALE